MEKTMQSDIAAENFIHNETQFHLGMLPTEQSHPKTRGLSEVLARDTVAGLGMLLSVDDDLPPVAERVFGSEPFARLVDAIRRAKAGGHRVVFSGCGATGRLAILLNAAVKRCARERGDATLANFTGSIMTGGDYALVSSVEFFEDYISFGYQQAVEIGLGEGDVLVAISEGGETSSVIGTILCGIDVGADAFFLFNNPAELLADRLERCSRVIRNPKVTVLELATGPMAVAGSTRMQATTMELLVAGAAVEAALFGADPLETLDRFKTMLAQLREPETLRDLAAFTDFECGIYREHGLMTYFADAWLLDIFTDTTERSPTFKLPPFRREGDAESPAPWTMVKSLARNTPDTWQGVYEGTPNCLAWTIDDYRRMGAADEVLARPPHISLRDLYSFKVGNEPDASRTERTPNAAMAILVGGERLNVESWERQTRDFQNRKVLRIGGRQPGDELNVAIDIPDSPLHLWEHFGLKLVLNNVSSAAMGKLGRLTGNWMSFVDTANKKLIDRGVRLISEIAGVDYSTACHALFATEAERRNWDVERRKTISPIAYTIERLTSR